MYQMRQDRPGWAGLNYPIFLERFKHLPDSLENLSNRGSSIPRHLHQQGKCCETVGSLWQSWDSIRSSACRELAADSQKQPLVLV